MKKLYFIFFSFLFCSVALGQDRYYSTSDGQFYGLYNNGYEYTNNGKTVTFSGKCAVLRSTLGTCTTVNIPSHITFEGGDVYPVRVIMENAFSECNAMLTSVSVPATVEAIEADAFKGCTVLTNIEFKDGTSDLYIFPSYSTKSPFYDTQNETVKLGRNLTYNTSQPVTAPFYNNYIVGLTITSDIRVPKYCFYNCNAMTTLTIQNNAKFLSVGNGAFYNCNKMVNDNPIVVDCPTENVSDSAFAYCSKISGSLSVTAKNIGIASFLSCSGLTGGLRLAAKSIGDYAFYSCSGFTSLTLANSVESIGYRTFEDCNSVATLTIERGSSSLFCGRTGGTAATAYGAFGYMSSLKTVVLGRDLTALKSGDEGYYESTAPFYKSPVLDVTILSSVTSVPQFCFYNCTQMGQCKGIDSISATIGRSAFESCTLLGGEVRIKAKQVDDAAFYNCSKIKKLTIGPSVETIGDRVFEYCDGVTTMTIEPSISKLACGSTHASAPKYGAFSLMEKLDTLFLARTLDYDPAYPAFVHGKVQNIYILNGCDSINLLCFASCDYIESLVIDGNLRKVCNRAFDFSPVPELKFPNEIPATVFYGEGFNTTHYEKTNVTYNSQLNSDDKNEWPGDWKNFGSVSSTSEPLVIYDNPDPAQGHASYFIKQDREDVNIQYERDFAEGLNDVCVPFALDSITLAQAGVEGHLYGLDHISHDTLYIVKVESVDAGVPCFVETEDEASALFQMTTDLVAAPVNGANWLGTFRRNIDEDAYFLWNASAQSFAQNLSIDEYFPLHPFRTTTTAACRVEKKQIIPEPKVGDILRYAYKGNSLFYKITSVASGSRTVKIVNETGTYPDYYTEENQPEGHLYIPDTVADLLGNKYAVTEFGDQCLRNVNEVTGITFNNIITNSGNYTVFGGKHCTTVELGAIQTMGYYFLDDCPLTSIDLTPFNEIPDYCLGHLAAEEVYIPATLTTISNASMQNNKVQRFVVDPNNPNYTAVDGNLYINDQKSFYRVAGGQTGDLILADSVTTISYGALWAVSARSKRNIYITSPELVTVGISNWNGYDSYELYVPCHLESEYKDALVEIPNNYIHGLLMYDYEVEAENGTVEDVAGDDCDERQMTAHPAEHYHFVCWEDFSKINPRSVNVDGNNTYTAYFALDEFTISADVNDDNYGMVIGAGDYAYGSEVTLEAVAYSGYEFSEWADGYDEAGRTFVVEDDESFVAIFVEAAPTDCHSTSDSERLTIKKMIDKGQLLIERNGVRYNALGERE